MTNNDPFLDHLTADNIQIKWLDEELSSYVDVVYAVLFAIDESMEEKGWDQPPILGVAHSTSLQGSGGFSISVPELDPAIMEDFNEGLSNLAHACFTAEVTGDTEEQHFLNTGVFPSFQGWLVSAEYTNQPPEENPDTDHDVRITLFVDMDNERYAVIRPRGSDKAVTLDNQLPTVITRPLALLNAASVMSVVRRQLLDTE